MDHAIATSTRRTYSSAKRRYLSFCHMYHIPPLPSSEKSLCRYVALLANEGLAHGSIKCYLAAVRHLHIEEGRGDPGISDMAKLELVLKGIKMVRASKRKMGSRQPITPELLHKMRGVWLGQPAGWDGKMLWAAATLCFFGFLRSGEITVPSESEFDEARHITFGDISVDCLDKPTTLRLRLKASKTDPFRVGVDVFVGKTGGPLCPVMAVLDYVVVRGARQGPLFHFQDGRPLTRARFVERVRGALTRAGIDSTP